MKQKNKIKLIAFDVGGVLQLNKTPVVKMRGGHRTLGVHEYVAKKLKVSLDQWFDSMDTAYAKSIEGLISKEKTLDIISKNLKVSKIKFRKVLVKAYKRNFKKNRGLYRIARKLKKRGYRIGILSDQWYFSQEALMPPKNVKGFNPVVVSCESGFRKPNPKIYKLFIKKSKCKASEILFIDNQIWNIKPAKKLGIKTILFKNNKQCIRELNKIGLLK